MVSFSAILPVFTGQLIISARFRLRLLERIGCGAYGVVYLAEDISAPEGAPSTYAVKCMLKPQPDTDFERVQQREFTYHKHLSFHPNITTLHEIIEDAYYVYVVMDYCEGGDLFSAIVDRSSFYGQDDSVKRDFVQLLDAVDACHEAGIFHRDLKPENVMCSHKDSRIYLSDFGLATQNDVSTSFGCGSSYYMSPECIGHVTGRAVPYSTRTSDVWSLGVILVNVLTGRNPWRIALASHDAGYAQYLQDGPKYLTSLLPVSVEAAHLLSRIFDPNPNTRVTIPQLRRALVKVHTFFRPTEEEQLEFAQEAPGLSMKETDALQSLLQVTVEPVKPASLVPFAPTPGVEVTESSFVNDYSSSSSSEADSPGPATPRSRSVEIEVVGAVPRLELDAKFGTVGLGLQLPQPAKLHNKLPRSIQRFMGAIYRIF